MSAQSLNVQRHNAILSSSRLPPEILGDIFRILSSIYPLSGDDDEDDDEENEEDDEEEDEGDNEEVSPKLGWVAITHVCQRWRDVALRDRTLWADITIPFPLGKHWAAAFLARAQDTPLTVIQDVAGNLSDMIKPSDEFASLSPDLSHALILRIFVGTSMHPALCTPMPLLRTLDLSSILQFPANLLGGASTPCLRHLGLACPGKLPWPSLPFAAAHLVSLEIGRFSADSMCSATFEDVFSPLERMPALERLVLRVNIDGTDGAHRVVALEQLRHIEVGNRMRVAGVRRFLEHLALPAVVTLGCSVYGAGRNRDEVRALFQLVTAYIPVKSRIGPLSSIQCKPIKTDYLPSVKVIAWRDVDAQDQPALALTFKLNKYGGRLTQMQTHIVQFALDALVSEDLRELGVWIGGDDPAWMDVLERVPKLQHLSVKGTAAAIALCDVLFHGKCAEDFLPALGTLTLADLNFWHLSMDSGRADPLRWWLVKRARAGRALRKLDLTECDADEEFKRKMKMAVPRLTVLYAEEMIW